MRESARWRERASPPEQRGGIGRLTLTDAVGGFDGVLADTLWRREERGCTTEKARTTTKTSSAPLPHRAGVEKLARMGAESDVPTS